MSTTPSTAAPERFTITHWLIVIVAAIGFLFDTYELLMFPVIARESLAELLHKPETSAEVREWTGRLLWMAAISGGVFGLLGGWLIDRFGRKTVMVGSILVYSFSPVCAAFSNELWSFVLFRCTTFIGVCVEFVAAVTWLAELFPIKRQRELAIGWTLAFSSIGGIFVTEVFNLIGDMRNSLPAFPVPEGFDSHATWRYTLLTGLIPGFLIAALLPFVPESKVWKDRRAAGTLKRPSFGAIFAPDLIRTTIVTTILSACAYAAAFGALQLTPTQIATGLPEYSARRETLQKELGPIMGKIKKAEEGGQKDTAEYQELVKRRGELQNELKKLTKERIGMTQRWQELGGLTGRILLAIFLIMIASRRRLLQIFQLPGILVFPLTYYYFFRHQPDYFVMIYFFCGLFTVAQFSYFGEYLPKVFPVHLRGIGGSFATNVGGRMFGTMAAPFVTEFLVKWVASNPQEVKPIDVATAAGIVGTSVFVIGFILSFWLPEPKEEG